MVSLIVLCIHKHTPPKPMILYSLTQSTMDTFPATLFNSFSLSLTHTHTDLLQYLDIVYSIWKLLLMMALEHRKWILDHVDNTADSLYVLCVNTYCRSGEFCC